MLWRSRPFLFYRMFRIIWKMLQKHLWGCGSDCGGPLDRPGDWCKSCSVRPHVTLPLPRSASVSLVKLRNSPSKSLEHTPSDSFANTRFWKVLRWDLLLHDAVHYAVYIITLSHFARHSLFLKLSACILLESLLKWQSHCKRWHLQWWRLLSGPAPHAFASWSRVV